MMTEFVFLDELSLQCLAFYFHPELLQIQSFLILTSLNQSYIEKKADLIISWKHLNKLH